MVISFSHDTAYDFLEEHGYVATFRESRRKQRNQDDWLNRGRGETKRFDIHITEIGKAEVGPNGEPSEIIDHFAPVSGFETPIGWRQGIEDVNGEVPDSGWVYLVKKIENGDE